MRNQIKYDHHFLLFQFYFYLVGDFLSVVVWQSIAASLEEILLMLILVIITVIIIVSFHLLWSFFLMLFSFWVFFFFSQKFQSISSSHLLFSLFFSLFSWLQFLTFRRDDGLLYRSLCYHYAAVATAARIGKHLYAKSQEFLLFDSLLSFFLFRKKKLICNPISILWYSYISNKNKTIRLFVWAVCKKKKNKFVRFPRRMANPRLVCCIPNKVKRIEMKKLAVIITYPKGGKKERKRTHHHSST